MTNTTLTNVIVTGQKKKWVQLALGLLCMISISSPQYVWALLTRPFMEKLQVPLAEIQLTFSLLIILQTFFSPFQGKLIDKFGPRRLITLGTVMSGVSWMLSANIQSLTELYLYYGVVGGLGTGIVYIGVVGLMVRWFPEKRGFATGMVAAGYGMGAILTTFPVTQSLAAKGLESTLWQFGLAMAVVGFIASQGLRAPQAAAPREINTPLTMNDKSFAPREMLRQPLFWLMFVMMTMMSTSGLMVTSQMAIFAQDFGITAVTIMGLAALPLAMTIDRFMNGLTRPICGYISDRIGRENMMFIAFGLEGCAMTLWLLCKDDPLLFVLLSGVVFFGWGEIFSLFPATLTDTFGTRYATANYGWLYISQGIGSIFGGPLAALLYQKTGNWNLVFGSAITLDILCALLAFFVLKPWRHRFMTRR
ncbi:oxalate/formate MFS antiporter [Enterobacter sp. R1(2018)]|uniref:oxalate/formate MFS antiporter n=1 Tax=Enterobacter sp. R1(2018) TaxID=2447891 RepID=UPI000EADC0E1|nr:oxalate/formate MFS antiporter [Enterobacter sp. R1(2018)]RKQ41148.1 oxalate/formate MFS antiporter [Enterobacter sp. R1(2018)]